MGIRERVVDLLQAFAREPTNLAQIILRRESGFLAPNMAI
jgi:hypothetical protein